MARRIMIQGTMSGVGKSLLTAALCRIFSQDGWSVAPFKSQNMALNSFVTRDSLEMGRAQVLQAQSAGLEPDVRMNPILLKPSGDRVSQVIVNGEVRCTCGAVEYYRMKPSLLPDVMAAYRSLAAEHDIIVIEGAGSPAELNLKKDDFVNMGLAALINAPVLLVGDIDPGGVFAQLYGTIALLEPAEQDRIHGLIVNRFRGDPALFRSGIQLLEERCRKPVLGVVPWMSLNLEEEDSQQGMPHHSIDSNSRLDVAVIRLPRISNFTDFDALRLHPEVSVRYVSSLRELGRPDLLILPGTKNTMGDLGWLRQHGLADAIRDLADADTMILGICGGYQMLGERLCDPEGVESGGCVPGLGLLPVETVFAREKIRRQTDATVTAAPFKGSRVRGYFIHMGRTVPLPDSLSGVSGNSASGPVSSFCTLSDGASDGTVRGRIFGTYLHGLFDTGELTTALVQTLLSDKGLSGAASSVPDYVQHRESELNRLADTVRHSLDLGQIYDIMEKYDGE